MFFTLCEVKGSNNTGCVNVGKFYFKNFLFPGKLNRRMPLTWWNFLHGNELNVMQQWHILHGTVYWGQRYLLLMTVFHHVRVTLLGHDKFIKSSQLVMSLWGKPNARNLSEVHANDASQSLMILDNLCLAYFLDRVHKMLSSVKFSNLFVGLCVYDLRGTIMWVSIVAAIDQVCMIRQN